MVLACPLACPLVGQKKVKCPYCPKMVRKGVDMRQHQDKHHADELKVHADEQERRKRDRERGYWTLREGRKRTSQVLKVQLPTMTNLLHPVQPKDQDW